MAELLLKAETGRAPGSRPARRLRREGKVPGVVYGLGAEPISVAVDYRELRAVLTTDAGMNALIDLEVGGDRQLSIVKELQRHPVRRDVTHVDFLLVDRTQEIEVEVPIVLVGDARQVSDENGVVDHMLFSLTVLAKPGSIPTELEIDISEMVIGDALRVGDLALPDGVSTDVDPEEPIVVASISAPDVEEEPEAAEGAEGAEPGDAEASADGDAEGESTEEG